MMKTKNARRRPMTRTPTRPSSSGVAAFAAPGRAFESRQPGTWTRRISHGYRERKTGASRARLPRRTAEATCCVAPRVVLPLEGFFFFFLFRLRRVTMRSRLLRAGFAEHSFFKAALFFVVQQRQRERERLFTAVAFDHACCEGLGLLWGLPSQVAGSAQLEEDLRRVRRLKGPILFRSSPSMVSSSLAQSLANLYSLRSLLIWPPYTSGCLEDRACHEAEQIQCREGFAGCNARFDFFFSFQCLLLFLLDLDLDLDLTTKTKNDETASPSTRAAGSGSTTASSPREPGRLTGEREGEREGERASLARSFLKSFFSFSL
jgi:hypothetical protein